MVRRCSTLWLILGCLTLLPACSGTPRNPPPRDSTSNAQTPNPTAIASSDYRRAYDSASAVLREQGFRLNRQDYRFGRITTQPLGSPTIMEPWLGLNATAKQAVTSTLQDVRRRVTVFLQPRTDQTQTDAPANDVDAEAGYTLRIEAVLERRQEPVRRLTGASTDNVFSRLSAVPAEWADRSIEAVYWQPIGRDRPLEQHLLQKIKERMSEKD